MAIVNALLVRYGGGFHECKVRLTNPCTGRPAFTGPNGEPGSAVITGSLTTEWEMPDGVSAWYETGAAPDPCNVAALAEYPITVYGRCEALLQLGNVNDVATVDAICQRIFALEASPMVATSAVMETGPLGTEAVPYDAFDIGDYITAPDDSGADATQRVVAISVAEDDDGLLTFTPQLNALLFEEDQRLQNWLKSMATGTVGGTVANAQPVAPAASAPVAPGTQQIGSAPTNELPPWSISGGLKVVTWGRYKLPMGASLAYVNVELEQASTAGDVGFELVHNGAAVASSAVTVPAGQTEGRTPAGPLPPPFSLRVDVGDTLEMSCTATGTGVDSAVVQVGYA